MKTKTEIFGNVCVIMTVKSNKYIIKHSKQDSSDLDHLTVKRILRFGPE